MKKSLFNKRNASMNKLFFTITLLISNFAAFAQTTFDDDVQDAPAAPINDWIIPGAILGCLFAFYLIKKSLKKPSEY